MSQQTTASMYGQGYTHTTPSFTNPNPGSVPYTSGYNGRAYPNPNGNYQAPYTTMAYIDPISLLGSSLGFLPNHAYQTPPRFNAYDQLEASGFGYETPPQFPFRPQPVDMTLRPARVSLGLAISLGMSVMLTRSSIVASHWTTKRPTCV
jgi:hypothetical protein